MSGILTNLFTELLAIGESFTLPEGFQAASVVPNSATSTFTVLNSSLGAAASSDIGFIVNFPISNNRSYADHLIECTAGSITILYYK